MKRAQIVLAVSLLTFMVLKPLVAFPDDRGDPPPENSGQRQSKVHDSAGTGQNEESTTRSDFLCDEDGDYCAPNPNGGYYGPALKGYERTQTLLMNQRNAILDGAGTARSEYYAALQRGDHSGARHYLNALRADERELANANVRLGLPANMGAYSIEPYYSMSGYLPDATADNAPTSQSAPAASSSVGNAFRRFLGN